MRLGRSTTILGATTALLAAVSAPALAATSNVDVTSTPTGINSATGTVIYNDGQTLTYTGTGCAPQGDAAASLAWEFGQREDITSGGASGFSISPILKGAVTPKADGTWTVRIDLSQIQGDEGTGGLVPAGVAFKCYGYGTGADTTGDLALALTIDGTHPAGSYKLSTAANGTQSISTSISGFGSNEPLTFRIVPADKYQAGTAIQSDYLTLATFTASEHGNADTTFALPTDIPDGRYKVGVVGSVDAAKFFWGETGVFEDILVKDGKVYRIEDAPTDGATDGGMTTPTDQATATTAPVVVHGSTGSGTAARTSTGTGCSSLAHTGTDSLALTVLAGGLAAGGAVLASRRRA